MSKKLLVAVDVHVGQRVAGSYRRGGGRTHKQAIDVLSIVDRDGRQYLVGYSESGPFKGAILTLIPDSFNPIDVKITDIEEFEDTFAVDEHYVTSGSSAFGFVDHVEPADVEWVGLVGGSMMENHVVETATIRVLQDVVE